MGRQESSAQRPEEREKYDKGQCHPVIRKVRSHARDCKRAVVERCRVRERYRISAPRGGGILTSPTGRGRDQLSFIASASTTTNRMRLTDFQKTTGLRSISGTC